MTTLLPQRSAVNGLKERFFHYFQHEVTALQEEMGRLANRAVTGGERADGVDHCLASIARLSREVKDASIYIPAYDQRMYGEAIKALHDKLDQTRASFAPRNKFSFKSKRQSAAALTVYSHRKNPSAISLEDAAELASQQRLELSGARMAAVAAGSGNTSTQGSSGLGSPAAPASPSNEGIGDASRHGQDDYVNRNLDGEQQNRSPVRKPSFSGSNRVTISGHSGLHIILPPTASHATAAGTVANLRRCIVDMSQPTASHNGGAPLAGLTVRHVCDSLLVCGRVAGAIHITSVQGCVLAVTARQFRMHDCKNVDVYLRCAGRPIIENCTGIRFAPLPSVYTHKDDPAQPNRWDQIDDFKWLRAEHSPNWCTTPAEECISEHVWKDLVPGGPGIGLEDILGEVKIHPKH